MMSRRVLFIACLTVAIRAESAAAQEHSTTQVGVYSVQQAVRGRDFYLGYCRSCHTPESHTGATFQTNWVGRSLAELYLYLRDRMPKNDPGTLSPQEYADVLAYLLRMNRMPSGERELSADSVALTAIRIETPKLPVRKDP